MDALASSFWDDKIMLPWHNAISWPQQANTVLLFIQHLSKQKPNKQTKEKEENKKSCFGTEYAQVFFGKMKPKKSIVPKAWMNQKCLIGSEWNGLHLDYLNSSSFFLFFFFSFFFLFFKWMALWMDKLQNFIANFWNWRLCHLQKSFLSSTFSQEFTWIEPEFSYCFHLFFFCQTFLSVEKHPPDLFLFPLNWFVFLLVLSTKYCPIFTHFSFCFLSFLVKNVSVLVPHNLQSSWCLFLRVFVSCTLALLCLLCNKAAD